MSTLSSFLLQKHLQLWWMNIKIGFGMLPIKQPRLGSVTYFNKKCELGTSGLLNADETAWCSLLRSGLKRRAVLGPSSCQEEWVIINMDGKKPKKQKATSGRQSLTFLQLILNSTMEQVTVFNCLGWHLAIHLPSSHLGTCTSSPLRLSREHFCAIKNISLKISNSKLSLTCSNLMFEFISDLNTEANSKLHFEEYLTWWEDSHGSFSSSLEYWALGFKIFITGFKKKKACHV